MEQNELNNQEQVNIEDLKSEMTELETVKAELETVKAENADLMQKLASAESSVTFNRNGYYEYMSQATILKNTLLELCERKKISKAEMYEAMMTANDMDLDMVLNKLGK